MRKIYFVGALAALGLFINAAVVTEQAAAAGVGQTCGGIAGIRCDRGLWCDPSPGKCRGADISGRCVRVPKMCIFLYKPVCGCNNRTYSNDCQRRKAKVQKRRDGPCRR
jgi:Kazal-type serine protease inhibitor domain